MELSKKLNNYILGLLSTSPLISFLHPPILQSILLENSFNFLAEILKITKLRKSKFRDTQIKVVSLNLKQTLDLPYVLNISQLFNQKKTTRTKELFKLLIPDPIFRTQIEQIRLNIFENIRKNQKVPTDKLRLILQLYFILNMEKHDIIQQVKYYSEKEKFPQLKKIVISIKKMIGPKYQLEKEEKLVKKKAYQHNIEVRQILSYCSNLIKQVDIRQKLQKVLSAPKNKKWFGSMFYKLLIKGNWPREEVLILSQYLKKVIKSPSPQIKKLVRNTRVTLNQSIRKMERQIQLMEKQSLTFTDHQEIILQQKIIKEQEQIDSLLNFNQQFNKSIDIIHYSSIQELQVGIDFLEDKYIW